MKKGLTDNLIDFGRINDFDKKHALMVADLSLKLFDQMQPLHRMGNTERLWLYVAAMMHDVAKNVDNRMHHKMARDAIIEFEFLPFGIKEQVMVGLIARYHRGVLPDKRHKYYKNLDAESKRYVEKLAAILRIADGLCGNSQTFVHSVKCSIKTNDVVINIKCAAYLDISKALRKTDLFEGVFGKMCLFNLKLQQAGVAVDKKMREF